MEGSRPVAGASAESVRTSEPGQARRLGPLRAELPAARAADTSSPSLETLREEFRDSLRAANERLAERGTSISMTVDRSTNTVIVQVKDRESGDTVRQIPAEAALQVSRNIDRLTGIIVDRKV
jgi:flagellar protein FlaG